MPKHKRGLHKEISSIFGGVPIPKDNGGPRLSSATTEEEAANYGPPSHLAGTTTKTQQPAEKSPPKAVPTEERKTAPEKKVAEKPAAIKTARQAWLKESLQRIKDKLFASKPGVSSTRQKMMVVLMPVMLIGMVLAFYKVLGFGPKGTTQAPAFKPSNAVAAAASTIDWQIPPPYPTTLRDPMRFGSVTTITQSEIGKIIVKGIVYSEDNPSAIIGTEIVHEGDKVSGATVVKINKDSVEFEMNGKKWTQKVR